MRIAMFLHPLHITYYILHINMCLYKQSTTADNPSGSCRSRHDNIGCCDEAAMKTHGKLSARSSSGGGNGSGGGGQDPKYPRLRRAQADAEL
jgi:hypothetical protein